MIADIADADDFPFWQTPHAIVITNVYARCIGGTNVVGHLQEYDGAAANPVEIDGDVTWLASAETSDDGTINDPIIDAGDWIGWKTTSVSGSVTHFCLTFEYEIR